MKPSTISAGKRFLRLVMPAAFWIAIWAIASQQVNRMLLLPSPLSVLQCWLKLIFTGIFWRNVFISLLRICFGTLIGCLLGVLLAVITEASQICSWIFSPVIRMMRAAPVASFIILLLLWFHTSMVPGIISGMMVLPILWENVSAGIHNIDHQLLQVTEVYQFSNIRKLKYLYLPSLRPAFTSGLCTAIGLSWKSGIASEVLCLPKNAIGTQLYYAKIYLETPSLFAWTGTVIMLSLLIEKLFRYLLGERTMSHAN